MSQPTFIIRPTSRSDRTVTFELRSIFEFRLPREPAFGAWAVVGMLTSIRKRSGADWRALTRDHPELERVLDEQGALGPSEVSETAHRWVSSWTLTDEGTYPVPERVDSLCATATLVLAPNAPASFLTKVPNDDWIHCFIDAPKVATAATPTRPDPSELKYLVVPDGDPAFTKARWVRRSMLGYVWGLDLDPGPRPRRWAAVAVRRDAVLPERGLASASDGWVDEVGDLETVQAFVRAAPGFVRSELPELHGTQTAGDGGTARVGDKGTAMAGADGTATAGDYGTAIVGPRGTATAGFHGTATAGMKGTAIAGDRGKAEAGHMGRASSGALGKSRVGKRGVAEAGVGGQVAAGEGGMLRVRRANGTWAETAVGGAIVADTLYWFEEEGSPNLWANEKPGWVTRKGTKW